MSSLGEFLPPIVSKWPSSVLSVTNRQPEQLLLPELFMLTTVLSGVTQERQGRKD